MCMYKGTPRTDWHVPMCVGVKSAYLPFMLAFNIHLTVLSICLSIIIRNPLFYCLFNYTIHSITTVFSTLVTTPHLYSLSVLYSHPLMKVAVWSTEMSELL